MTPKRLVLSFTELISLDSRILSIIAYNGFAEGITVF